ncbi:MAG: preprotein translocase subunit YajC [Opitutales bacterium]|nr:preprotein translocase subunit YajC [Opitutales bacterium]MBP3358475.1 preprotein translocase subunit YajC [Opitutales bacterium]
MYNLITVLSQATAPAETAPQGGGSSMLLFVVLMFAAMYFLMIAPQRKRQKQHQKMLSELKTGDKVLTIGGMIGTISNVKEKTFIVKLGDNNKVEFIKSAIQDKIVDEIPAEQK